MVRLSARSPSVAPCRVFGGPGEHRPPRWLGLAKTLLRHLPDLWGEGLRCMQLANPRRHLAP